MAAFSKRGRLLPKAEPLLKQNDRDELKRAAKRQSIDLTDAIFEKIEAAAFSYRLRRIGNKKGQQTKARSHFKNNGLLMRSVEAAKRAVNALPIAAQMRLFAAGEKVEVLSIWDMNFPLDAWIFSINEAAKDLPGKPGRPMLMARRQLLGVLLHILKDAGYDDKGPHRILLKKCFNIVLVACGDAPVDAIRKLRSD